MRKTALFCAAVAVALTCGFGTVVHAAPIPKAVKCPSCGMQMPDKKAPGATVPVKVKGHTYYCCPSCANGKAASKMMTPAKKAPAKAAAPAPKAS